MALYSIPSLRRLFRSETGPGKNESPSYLDWRKIGHMKRLVLLGAAVLGLSTGAVACANSPVEPGSSAAFEPSPSFGKKSSSTTTVTTNCSSLVYPSSLCSPTDLLGNPGRREALCAALRYGGGFNDPVVGREASESFARTTKGAVETVVIPRPYGYPPTVLTFTLTTAQIESAGMCLDVVTQPPPSQ